MKKRISMLLALLFCIPLSLIGCSSEPINILTTDSGKISVNASGAFIIDGDNKLWAYGSNVSNQLGLGWDVYKTSEPKLVMEDVVKVSSYNGVSYSLALKNDGSVWQWGPPQGFSNIVVNPTDYQGSSEVLLKKVFDDAKDIAVTSDGAMAVKSNDEVWAWGSDIFGFIPDETKLCKNKEPYLIMKNGKYVYTRFQSFGVLTENGELYCWGDFLGDYQYTPKKVAQDVKQVNFGYTTYFLKQDNSLWGIGDNSFGQLGNGQDFKGDSSLKESIVQSPVKIVENVKDFAHVGVALAFVKEDNTVWGCGDNRSGLLGNGVAGYDKTRCENRPIQIDSGVSNVYSSDNDTLFYMKNNALMACGSNLSGMLGTGDNYDSDAEWGTCMISKPKKVLDGNIIDFYISNNNHVVCLMGDGKVLRWGKDPLFFFSITNATESIPKEYAFLTGTLGGGNAAFRSLSEKAFFNIPHEVSLPDDFAVRTQ